MTKKERLINRIIEHKDYIVSQGIAEDRILGVFLYGSQNYNTDTENSDVDTKAISDLAVVGANGGDLVTF